LLPPNFNALPLKKPPIMTTAEKALASGAQIGFIDTDSQSDIQAVFEVEALAQAYASLKAKMSEAFRSLISDTAREEWV
jgi:hypothetical protein